MANTARIVRGIAQGVLGAALLAAGVGHLIAARREFQAQVPSWIPADPDAVVVGSGVVEIGLGVALASTWQQPARRRLGVLVAGFFAAVFPGNIAQLVEHRDAFGLDSAGSVRCDCWGSPCSSCGLWRLLATDGQISEGGLSRVVEQERIGAT